MERIVRLIESDQDRMRILRAVKSLDISDWLVAAGFIRDMVWGSIYGNSNALNDIDVIYFCLNDTSKERDLFL